MRLLEIKEIIVLVAAMMLVSLMVKMRMRFRIEVESGSECEWQQQWRWQCSGSGTEPSKADEKFALNLRAYTLKKEERKSSLSNLKILFITFSIYKSTQIRQLASALVGASLSHERLNKHICAKFVGALVYGCLVLFYSWNVLNTRYQFLF